jgi:Ca2+-binding RTX toxin-like protein
LQNAGFSIFLELERMIKTNLEMVNMNMIVNASDLVVSEAESNKLKKAASRDAVSKLVKLWETRQVQKAKTFGGLGLMAVSLAACNSSSDDTATTTTTPTTPATPATPTVTATTAALTTSANTVTMTSGDDTITGTNTTLTAGDIIVDHNTDDNDTITITGAQYGTAITSAGATISGVEAVNINFNAMTASTFTASGVYGSVVSVDTTLSGGNTAVTVADVNAGVTVNAGASVLTLTVEGNAIADNTTITVGGGSATTITATGTDGQAAATTAGDVSVTASEATTVTAGGNHITVTAPKATAINLEGTSVATSSAGAATATADHATVTSDGATTITMHNVDSDGGENANQSMENITLSGSAAALVATIAAGAGVETIVATGSQNVTVIMDAADASGEEFTDSSTATTIVEFTEIGAGDNPDLSKMAPDSFKINDATLGASTFVTAAGATVDYADEGNATLTFDMDDDTTTNVTTGTLNLTLSDAITSQIAVDQTASSDNFDKVAVTVTKAQTSLDLRATTTVDVTLSGAVTVALDNTSTAKTLDAGSMTAALTAAGTSANLKSITTGSGNDNVTLSNDAGLAISLGAGNDQVTIGNMTLAADSVIDGGAGTDTLNLGHANANTGTGAGAITGFEIFAVTAAAQINSAHIAGKVIMINGAQALTLTNINTAAVDMSNVTGAGAFTTVINATGNIGSLIGAGTSFAITGTAKADTITGNSAADTLLGEDGNDIINGAGSADSINGGAGNDRILGNAGADDLTGGAGNDTFVFLRSEVQTTDAPTIKDFSVSGTNVDILEINTSTGGNLNGIGVGLTDGNGAASAGVGDGTSRGADVSVGLFVDGGQQNIGNAADDVILFYGGTSGTAGIANGIDGLVAALAGGTASDIRENGGSAHAATEEMVVVVENTTTNQIDVGIITNVGANGFGVGADTVTTLFEVDIVGTLTAAEVAAAIDFTGIA